jgi:ferric-dicitrate binding protein FerR (iron transport regulator)
MLNEKLGMRPPKQPRSQDERALERWRVAAAEHEQLLMGLWRALDDVEGKGQLRGFITRGEEAQRAEGAARRRRGAAVGRSVRAVGRL